MPTSPLTPGQRYISDFPRFGLPRYAKRFPSKPRDRSITIKTPSDQAIVLNNALSTCFRTEVTADFHCVTTWSHANLTWSGVLFTDFYKHLVQPHLGESPIVAVAFYAQDGYKTTLLLQDLLAENVLLADTLYEKPLSIEHGAPIRLIAPSHYGYKNIKHLKRIEFHTTVPKVKTGLYNLLDHPRARVSLEERGRLLPGWLLRRLYRPLITGTQRKFNAALIDRPPPQSDQ